jgi:hypothetical protein
MCRTQGEPQEVLYILIRFVLGEQTIRLNVLDKIIASIKKIRTPLNLLLNHILFRYSCFQIF